MNINQQAPGLLQSHDAVWWIGQFVSLILALTLLWNGYGGPVAAVVGYALVVLVDIREAVSRGGKA